MEATVCNKKKAASILLSAFIGTCMGSLTLIGQKYLPVNLHFLANSASVWLIPAFLVPYCLRGNKKQSALSGIIVLLFCVLGYYGFEAVCHHHAYSINRHQALWLCCAGIGGVVTGLCGYFARTKVGVVSDLSRNLLPAVFVTEASSKLFHIRDYRHMLLGLFLQILLGILLYVSVNGKSAWKRKNVFSFLVLLLLGSLAFEILFRV